jgi:hypothetical protein
MPGLLVLACGGGGDSTTDASISCDGTRAFYRDSDGDDFGTDTDVVMACAAPMGFVDIAGDCDDALDTVHPDADETCDGVDNDCDPATVDGAEACEAGEQCVVGACSPAAWIRAVGTGIDDHLVDVDVLASGYLVSGWTAGGGTGGGFDGLVVRLDPSGEAIWSKALAGTGSDNVHAAFGVEADAVVCLTTSSLPPTTKGIVARVTPAGETLWSLTLSDTGGVTNGLQSCAQLPDDSVVAAWRAQTGTQSLDVYTRIAPDGSVIWSVSPRPNPS